MGCTCSSEPKKTGGDERSDKLSNGTANGTSHGRPGDLLAPPDTRGGGINWEELERSAQLTNLRWNLGGGLAQTCG